MVNIEFIVPKKLSRDGGAWLPKNVGAMKKIGEYAISAIRKRMKTTQKDGEGRKLPRLVNKGWFWTAENDNRFAGKLKRLKWAKSRDQGMQRVLAEPDGYAAAKRKLGAKPRKDGTLTGDMWRGLVATLKKKKGGWAIRLHFKGGTKTGKVMGWGNRTIKKLDENGNTITGSDGKPETEKIKVPKMKTRTSANRDKALALQYKGTRPVVALLSLTEKEQEAIRDMYARLIRPFGDK